MELLILLQVAAALDAAFRGAVLVGFRQESATRFRLVGEGPEGRVAAVLSMRPDSPWIGRPHGPWDGPRWSPGPFASSVAPALVGAFIEGVAAPAFDRFIRIRMRDGHSLVAELAPHATSLVWLDSGDAVLHLESNRRGAGARLCPGERYRAPDLPPGKRVPGRDDGATIEGAYRECASRGSPPEEALRRTVFGIGGEVARLLVEEADASGVSPPERLQSRLREVRNGLALPVIIGPGAADTASFDPARSRLLPWDPPEAVVAGTRTRLDDAAGTVGLWYEARDRVRSREAWREGIHAVLRREIDRTRDARRRAEADAARFDDPEAHRRRGVALLAGLASVRREGNDFFVPDPERPDGPPLRVPGRPGGRPQDAAEEEFRFARRAERGIRAARERVARLAARRERLEALDRSDPEALAEAMRAEGIPVDLRHGTPQQKRASRAGSPRVEGVRMVTSRDGWTILVGKSGRENDRLTFKIAAPEDFWLHVRGVAGAHVVVRNPDRRAAPPGETLFEAAALAAWYSDARGESQVDVQWTRRKHVRRARGAPPGTVRVKRFETVRVRPSPPRG